MPGIKKNWTEWEKKKKSLSIESMLNLPDQQNKIETSDRFSVNQDIRIDELKAKLR